MGMKDSERPSSSSCGEIVNKENVNSNKPVMPKLSVEPQQMKKKKKGGGYNLRKSLAWDKAFFTEEGFIYKYIITLSNSLSFWREVLNLLICTNK